MKDEEFIPDPLHDLLAEEERLRRSGYQIINLGAGSPDKPPHSLVAETMCEEVYDDKMHGYEPPEVLPRLLRAFTYFYDRNFGVALDPRTEVVATDGAKHGILLASLALLRPSDRVLVPNPGYTAYANIARLVGAEPVEYRLTAEGHYHPDLEALEQTDLTGVKMMWVNYPSMPTGAAATPELFERLVKFGREHGITIAHDASQALIGVRKPLSLLAVEGAKEAGVLEINSLSISHNMAGWRMGMIAGGAEAVSRIDAVRRATGAGRLVPLVKASIAALHLPAKWYKELNLMYDRRRRMARQLLETLGCTLDVERSAGLFLWARIPDSETSAEEMCRRLLYDKHVFMVPGSFFGSEGERYVRVAICTPSARINTAYECVTGKAAPPVPVIAEHQRRGKRSGRRRKGSRRQKK